MNECARERACVCVCVCACAGACKNDTFSMKTVDKQSIRATYKLYVFCFVLFFNGVQNKMPRTQLITAYPNRTDLDR